MRFSAWFYAASIVCLANFFEQAAPKMCEANTVLKVRSFTDADMRLPLKTPS